MQKIEAGVSSPDFYAAERLRIERIQLCNTMPRRLGYHARRGISPAIGDPKREWSQHGIYR